MRNNSRVSFLWALSMFVIGLALFVVAMYVVGLTFGWLHPPVTTNHPKGVQPAIVHSMEVLERHKAEGLHSSYRRGSHNYLEVHYEGEWQTLKCSLKGWEQQGLYFRQNRAEVAEECELEKSVKPN